MQIRLQAPARQYINNSYLGVRGLTGITILKLNIIFHCNKIITRHFLRYLHQAAFGLNFVYCIYRIGN